MTTLLIDRELAELVPDMPAECPKCFDPRVGVNTGWYRYDDKHSTVCDLCCLHDQGYWMLTNHHGNPGQMCCLAGCGRTLTLDEYDALFGGVTDQMRVQGAEYKRLHDEERERWDRERAEREARFAAEGETPWGAPLPAADK